MEDAIKIIQREIDKYEKFIKKQSSFYLQYEDQGYTSVKIRELKRIITLLRT